jgi:hypothetical protein
MSKLNLSRLKLLPAPAGWLFSILLLVFAAAMCIPAAHASQPDYTCTPHKTILGFAWGWDCHVPQYTSTLTLKTDSSTIWCSQSGAGQECKTATQGTLKINDDALDGLINARRFDLAMRCTTTPHNPEAHCEIAIKSGEKGDKK